jgi:hypothetical protein
MNACMVPVRTMLSSGRVCEPCFSICSGGSFLSHLFLLGLIQESCRQSALLRPASLSYSSVQLSEVILFQFPPFPPFVHSARAAMCMVSFIQYYMHISYFMFSVELLTLLNLWAIAVSCLCRCTHLCIHCVVYCNCSVYF